MLNCEKKNLNTVWNWTPNTYWNRESLKNTADKRMAENQWKRTRFVKRVLSLINSNMYIIVVILCLIKIFKTLTTNVDCYVFIFCVIIYYYYWLIACFKNNQVNLNYLILTFMWVHSYYNDNHEQYLCIENILKRGLKKIYIEYSMVGGVQLWIS